MKKQISPLLPALTLPVCYPLLIYYFPSSKCFHYPSKKQHGQVHCIKTPLSGTNFYPSLLLVLVINRTKTSLENWFILVYMLQIIRIRAGAQGRSTGLLAQGWYCPTELGLPTSISNKKKMGQRNALVVKSTVCTCRGHGFDAYYPHGSSQLAVTPEVYIICPVYFLF